ncbi:hypothetical protein BOX15_Mlig029737g2 [Macrostomum lignano]|uniref:Ig-like domain-containing protein n=1 Tax=Macrostomum lignano TaxID=282301 RepID=A0A267GSH0_9PLAT|nr:hypothetical protein BOX15_Mlig029737g2 [Macrostomum lignano]
MVGNQIDASGMPQRPAFQAAFGLIILACQLLPRVHGCPGECVCTAANQAVLCSGVTNQFNDYAATSLPAWTVRLYLLCLPRLSSGGRPLPLGPALSALSPGVFRRLVELREISIRSCPIGALPAGLFAHLPALTSVTLDNMLFTSLPPGLFQGSQSIAELILQRCHEYTSQTPALLVDTPRLRLLKLIEVGLSGEQLDNLLKSAPTGMMQTLEVIMTLYPPLRLSGATLSAFSLTSLSLSNNGITDFAFLPSVGAAEVTLSYNRAPLGRIELETSSIQPNRRVTLLRLEHSGLNEIPSFLSVVFPELAELNLASNIIQQLEPSRLANLSRLVRLDLSGNQIQTLSDWRRLQPLLSAILYRDRQSGHIYLAENPIHCNCELSWIYDNPILSSSLLRDLTCQSGQFVGQLLVRLQKHQLRCRPPTVPDVTLQYWPAIFTSSDAGVPRVANETVILPGQQCNLTRRRNVTLTCSSSADPAPGLAWRLLLPSPSGGQQTAQELVRSRVSQDRQSTVTSLTLLVEWLPLEQLHLLECVSSSRYFEFSPRTNLTILLPSTDEGEGPAEGKADRVRMK